jgi:hypothetical protein
MLTMKSEVVGRPSAVSDDFLQSIGKKYVKESASQFQMLSYEFPQISRTV